MKTTPIVLIMALFLNFENQVLGQQVDLDSLEYTTAKVKLIEEYYTGCHLSTSYYTFKVVKHITGPHVEKGSVITSMLLTGYINGDATKITDELYDGKITDEEGTNELVINFTNNQNPKKKIENSILGCYNPPDYFDYGISYIRWAVREQRKSDMLGLDAFMQKQYNKKFHLLGERDGKFLFEHHNKKMLAFKMYDEWKLAEVKEDN